MAKYWNDWNPKGMWDFRWGDQQWWPRPMAMFSDTNLSVDIDHYDEINTENNRYVIHKLWPRFGTISRGSYFNWAGSNRTARDAIYAKEEKAFIYRSRS